MKNLIEPTQTKCLQLNLKNSLATHDLELNLHIDIRDSEFGDNEYCKLMEK